MYIIYNKLHKTYMHFNPYTKKYFEDDKLLGSVVFKKEKAITFLLELGVKKEDGYQLIR